jgi:hypothetical protein
MHIKALASLSHSEVADLARAAADRGEDLEQANPFPAGHWRRATFEDVFRERSAELALA